MKKCNNESPNIEMSCFLMNFSLSNRQFAIIDIVVVSGHATIIEKDQLTSSSWGGGRILLVKKLIKNIAIGWKNEIQLLCHFF